RFTIAALKNELRKLTENSVNTKFAKPSILGKPVLQPLRNQSVVRQSTAYRSERPDVSKPRFSSQVDVNNILSKPVTLHYVPKVRESVFVKPNHEIASGSFKNNTKESGVTISLTEAAEEEDARQFHGTHARIVIEFEPKLTKKKTGSRSTKGVVIQDTPSAPKPKPATSKIKIKGVQSLTPEEQEAANIMQAPKKARKPVGDSQPGVLDEEKVTFEEKVILKWGSKQDSEYSEEDQGDDEKSTKGVVIQDTPSAPKPKPATSKIKIKGVQSLTPEEQEAANIMQAPKKARKPVGDSQPGVLDEEKVTFEEKVILKWGSKQDSEYSEEDQGDDEKGVTISLTEAAEEEDARQFHGTHARIVIEFEPKLTKKKTGSRSTKGVVIQDTPSAPKPKPATSKIKIKGVSNESTVFIATSSEGTGTKPGVLDEEKVTFEEKRLFLSGDLNKIVNIQKKIKIQMKMKRRKMILDNKSIDLEMTNDEETYDEFVKETPSVATVASLPSSSVSTIPHIPHQTKAQILTPPITINALTITTNVPESDALSVVQLRVAKLEKYVSELKKIDNSAKDLATLNSQVPTKPTIDLEQESEKSASEIYKIKREQAKKKKMQIIQLKCFNALTNKLDWNNLEGDHYPFDLSKPLPLQGRLDHLTVAADYFFNNDLEFLKTSDPEKTYTTSILKTKAARSQMNKFSKHNVYSTQRILGVKSVSVKKLHGYSHLEEVMTFLEIEFKELYTLSYKPLGVIYEDLTKQKQVMQVDELYKFSNETLKKVRDELHHRILDFVWDTTTRCQGESGQP
nr:hypothetical protein [Tanacetum cinerariifolium]